MEISLPKGLGGARNGGVTAATGDIVVFWTTMPCRSWTGENLISPYADVGC
jgi:hypothetical protein